MSDASSASAVTGQAVLPADVAVSEPRVDVVEQSTQEVVDEIELEPGKKIPKSQLLKILAEQENFSKQKKEYERGWNKRMQEAALQQRAYEQQLAQYQEQLRQIEPILKDPDAFAQRRALELYEESQKTPEQRIKEENERLRQENENFKRSQEEQQQNAQREQLTEQMLKTFDKEFSEAAARNGLPRAPEVFAEMFKVAEYCFENGVNLTYDQVAQVAKKRVGALGRQALPSTPQELVEFLGKDAVQQLIEHVRGQAKPANQALSNAIRSTPAVKTSNQSGRPMRESEYRAKMEGKFNA